MGRAVHLGTPDVLISFPLEKKMFSISLALRNIVFLNVFMTLVGHSTRRGRQKVDSKLGCKYALSITVSGQCVQSSQVMSAIYLKTMPYDP